MAPARKTTAKRKPPADDGLVPHPQDYFGRTDPRASAETARLKGVFWGLVGLALLVLAIKVL